MTTTAAAQTGGDGSDARVPSEPAAGQRRRRSVAVEALIVAVLAIATVAVLAWHADEQDFTVDESRWIATSRYFWITFVERDLFGPAWQPNYLVLTHPPVARYLIGFGLWLQGWSPELLNGRYDTDRSREYNRERGNIPGADLLDAARRVVLVFAVAATLLLYPIGRIVSGPIGGAAAVVLALANPLLATLWTRALAESILAFFSLAGLLLALLLCRGGSGRPPYGLALGVGLALGLAAATKLSGAFVGVGVALFAAVQRAALWATARRWPGVGLWLDALLAAVLAFVLVNPLLYPHPVARTAMLFEHRRDEMQQQARGTPRLAVPPRLADRAELMFRRTFLEYGTLNARLGVPADALLAAAGLVVVVIGWWRRYRRSGVPGPELLLVSWTVVTFGISTVSLGFNSSHYFALPVLLAVLMSAIALATLARGLASLASARSGRIGPGRRP